MCGGVRGREGCVDAYHIISYHGGDIGTGHGGHEINHRIGARIEGRVFKTAHGAIPNDRLTAWSAGRLTQS